MDAFVKSGKRYFVRQTFKRGHNVDVQFGEIYVRVRGKKSELRVKLAEVEGE